MILNGQYALCWTMCVFGAHHKNLKDNRLKLLVAKMLPIHSSFQQYKDYGYLLGVF